MNETPPALNPGVLEGRFVRLEPLRSEHSAELAGAAAEPELWRWFPSDLSRPGELGRWVEAAVQAARTGTEYPFCVRDLGTGAAVGSTRYLDIDSHNRAVEIGWTWYGRAAWGTQVNPESKLLLLRYAFDVWGAHRVFLKTDSLNERSRAAIEKMGGVFEGILRKHRIRRDGSFRHSAYYSVLDDEWASVRSLLEARLR